MERVPVSKFKATCLALLERVRRPASRFWSPAEAYRSRRWSHPHPGSGRNRGSGPSRAPAGSRATSWAPPSRRTCGKRWTPTGAAEAPAGHPHPPLEPARARPARPGRGGSPGRSGQPANASQPL